MYWQSQYSNRLGLCELAATKYKNYYLHECSMMQLSWLRRKEAASTREETGKLDIDDHHPTGTKSCELNKKSSEYSKLYAAKSSAPHNILYAVAKRFDVHDSLVQPVLGNPISEKYRKNYLIAQCANINCRRIQCEVCVLYVIYVLHTFPFERNCKFRLSFYSSKRSSARLPSVVSEFGWDRKASWTKTRKTRQSVQSVKVPLSQSLCVRVLLLWHIILLPYVKCVRKSYIYTSASHRYIILGRRGNILIQTIPLFLTLK